MTAARMLKPLKWIALTVGGLVLVVAALLAWLIHAESGARWLAATLSDALGAKLDIGAVAGSIAGPLTLTDLRYLDPAAGVALTAQRVAIDLALTDLMRLVVRVRRAQLTGVDLSLHEAERPAPVEKTSQPFSLDPPIDLVIDSLVLNETKIRSEDVVLLDLTRVDFAGHWTSADLAVERLDVRSPQGEIHFDGRVDRQRTYVGEGRGRFRWRAGETTYAGALTTRAAGENAQLAVNLSAPVNARLDASVEQTERWPWRFTLEVPRFDPREQWLPESKLQSLAATLRGAGQLASGVLSGRIVINEEPLAVEALRFTREAQRMTADARLRVADSAGDARARGDIEFAQDGWTAKLNAAWGEVVIPAAWAGQPLHTRGRLDLQGDVQQYRARGAIAIGPSERIADIALDVEGSPDAVELAQFDVVQPHGKLAASGKVQFKPQLAWNMAAEARGFDPGAFLVAWPGRLNFNLASGGRLTDKGPEATLRLRDLTGALRGRTVSGRADLSLAPPLTPAGTLMIRSGESELRFRGQPGDAINATIALDVASLNDWAPDAGGELKAGFVVRGRWPELFIEGDARGDKLSAANVRADALQLAVRIDDLHRPQGAVRLDLTKLAAAGLEFDSVRARASGDAQAHRLTLDAAGSPLAIDLGLDGARSQDGWAGSVQRLVLDVQNAARLTLRAPARLVVRQGEFEMSRACLADGAVELCAGGAKQSDGALSASYSLANAPLAIANVLTRGEAPLKFGGAVDGRGEIRRTAQGELQGEALINSPSGSVSRLVAEGETEAPQTLLSWRDLRVAAHLAGESARATLSAGIGEQGALDAAASVRGLGQARSPLSGRVSATLPDLAPFAVFAPQLANFSGRADARFDIAGALQAPEISGALHATELAADLPAVGLHLRNGRLSAEPSAGGVIALAGGVESGKGRLEFAGTASRGGALDVNISGDRFLAADIPGARILVTPALNFTRMDERLKLSGKVTIPEADVNLQKLPRAERAQKVSSDVVVIDAKTREEEAAAAPLYAQVTVILGDDVQLTGFGLQAKVDGRLDVKESPGEPTLGSGEMRVSGAYKAYGQDLQIQEGRLLYAGTPLDNPRLSIEATRVVGEVTAGLRVRGSAQAPELTVFSEPPMGQANALSYLVAGKPLEDVGAEEGESDALQAATRSLGTAAGGLLAKNLGRRLGVGELAVKDDEMIGGAALTVGQYLSPRLYLSYGVGLFEPGEVVTLRYKLSEELSVKTQRGPEDTRTGVEYRIER